MTNLKGTEKQIKYANDILEEIKKYQKKLNKFTAIIQETTSKDLSETLSILDLINKNSASEVIKFGKKILKKDITENGKKQFILDKLNEAKREEKINYSRRYFNKVIRLQNEEN
ncbi:MAG: hypothetical protein U9N34_07680 [Candidatus Cloacimonadota bacterium]|nr:hypothetical protein [Candidatus Cloacimonadota bacterium]